TLIADSGWPGLAVHLGAGFTWMRGIGGATVASGGSTPMPQLARWCARQGLSGLAWGVSFPGSVGGAVRMNAGAHGHDTSEVLREADVVDLDGGARQTLPVAHLALA